MAETVQSMKVAITLSIEPITPSLSPDVLKAVTQRVIDSIPLTDRRVSLEIVAVKLPEAIALASGLRRYLRGPCHADHWGSSGGGAA